jgi:hypothetical protein
MSSEEAKDYLANIGLSSCSCVYGGTQELIEEAIRLKELETKKPTD